uniref:Transthyretin-like family protein n=1 Tax=Rhabditophanes sp. KR3021 TaxID=114890 RepID=A0AC35UFJ3_9BILA
MRMFMWLSTLFTLSFQYCHREDVNVNTVHVYGRLMCKDEIITDTRLRLYVRDVREGKVMLNYTKVQNKKGVFDIIGRKGESYFVEPFMEIYSYCGFNRKKCVPIASYHFSHKLVDCGRQDLGDIDAFECINSTIC